MPIYIYIWLSKQWFFNLSNFFNHVCVLVALSCATLCNPTRLFCPWDSPGKNTRVSNHSQLQRIFLTQGSCTGFLHWRQLLYHLSHQGNPFFNHTVHEKSVNQILNKCIPNYTPFFHISTFILDNWTSNFILKLNIYFFYISYHHRFILMRVS